MKNFGLALLVFLLSPLSFSEVDLSPQYCEVFNEINNIDLRADFSENKTIYKRVCIDETVQDLTFSDIVNNATFINQTIKKGSKQNFLNGLKAFTSKKIKNRVLTYTKLPGVKANKFKIEQLDYCIEQNENNIKFKNKKNSVKKLRSKKYIDLPDTIPYDLFQANNFKLVLQAKSIIEKLNRYKKNMKDRAQDINFNKEKNKGRIKRNSEINDELNFIRNRDQDKTDQTISRLETELFALSSKEPWLFDFGRNFTPSSEFLERDYRFSSVGEIFIKDLPNDVKTNLEFLQSKNYDEFLKSHPSLENHFNNLLGNDKLKDETILKINKKLEEDLSEANALCKEEKDRLHHFPQLVEEYINQELAKANSTLDAFRLQAAYCEALEKNQLDEKGLSSWVTGPAIAASVGGSLLLLANPVGLIGGVAYALVTAGGTTLAFDTTKTFVENMHHINEINQVHQIGLTDIDKIISANDEVYINLAEGVASLSSAGAGNVIKFFKNKDKLKEMEKWMSENLDALSEVNNPNAMVGLVSSRHDGTVHDYIEDFDRMDEINKREGVRKLNHIIRKKNEKGTRNLLNVVAAKYQTKEYIETLKKIRNDSGKESDEAFDNAYAILKKHNNYDKDYQEIIKEGYLNRAKASELAKYKGVPISEREPLTIYLPKIDQKTGEIISSQGDIGRKVTYTDPGVFKEDLEMYTEKFKASFNFNINEESSSLIGKSQLSERLQEQASLRRKISRMKAELESVPNDELNSRQLALKKELRLSYKKPRLYPRDLEASIQEKLEKTAEYKELGRLVLHNLTARQFWKSPLEEPSKLTGKLAVFAGYTTVVGSGTTAVFTNIFDESSQSGAIGKLRAEFANGIDVVARSVLNATADEKQCARELRGWSFRNTCLIPLMKRYLGVELAERKFDSTKSLLSNPVARQKAREYMKFLLRLKVFDGTGEVNQLISQELPKTSAEVGIEVLNNQINKVVENEISIKRQELSKKLSKNISQEQRNKLLEEAQFLLSKESEVAARTQLIADLAYETDPIEREKKIQAINEKYNELATVTELIDQKALAASMVEYGSLPADIVNALEELSVNVAKDDVILKQLNFLNSPTLGDN